MGGSTHLPILLTLHLTLLFHGCDLDINPMTLKLEGDLDIMKPYLHAET